MKILPGSNESSKLVEVLRFLRTLAGPPNIQDHHNRLPHQSGMDQATCSGASWPIRAGRVVLV